MEIASEVLGNVMEIMTAETVVTREIVMVQVCSVLKISRDSLFFLIYLAVSTYRCYLSSGQYLPVLPF